jgi:hypothetical protein
VQLRTFASSVVVELYCWIETVLDPQKVMHLWWSREDFWTDHLVLIGGWLK